LSELEIEKKIIDILDELGLTKVKDSLIGYVGEGIICHFFLGLMHLDATMSGLSRGISGGERKRLSLGLELLSSPSLLFLVKILRFTYPLTN
jgi:ABC-type glutathione transport system ATPase component